MPNSTRTPSEEGSVTTQPTSAVVIVGQRTITVHPAVDAAVWPGHVWDIESTTERGRDLYRAHNAVHGDSAWQATVADLAAHLAVCHHDADHGRLEMRTVNGA